MSTIPRVQVHVIGPHMVTRSAPRKWWQKARKVTAQEGTVLQLMGPDVSSVQGYYTGRMLMMVDGESAGMTAIVIDSKMPRTIIVDDAHFPIRDGSAVIV
jgi:hypothetical protein